VNPQGTLHGFFFVSAALTALGTLGMVYIGNRCKPSSVSFISARSDRRHVV